MKNRYGNTFSFKDMGNNTYAFVGSLDYCRFGGLEGQERVDYNDLGFFDPSGGPFISCGYKIGGKPVTKIKVVEGQVLFKVAG